jgi:hypothetical protein
MIIARRRREEALQLEALEQRRAIVRRRFGAHRLGRRKPRRGAHGGERPEARGAGGEERREQHGAAIDDEFEHRKPEELRVRRREELAQAEAQHGAERRADRRDDERHLEIVTPDREARVAERLQRRDLLALGAHQAREDNVEDERRRREEDRRRHERHCAQVAELVRDELVRRLVVASVRALPAVRGGDAIDLVEDRALRSAGRERYCDVVERAVEIERWCHLAIRHPENREVALVGKKVAGPHLIDVLGRERESDDREFLQPAVDDRAQLGAGLEAVGFGECLADQRLGFAQRIGKSSAAQVQLREPEGRLVGDRDDVADRRLGHLGHVEVDVHDDARLDARDVGDLGDLGGDRVGRALGPREDVRKPIALVVRAPRRLERRERAERHDERAGAAAHHKRGRDELRPEPPEVAPKFGVERAHQAMLAGSAFSVLRVTE